MKIKDLCESERPREKMLEKGPGALSNGELLAILLRNGTREFSAVELAGKLSGMAEGSLVRLFGLPFSEMKTITGIGPLKACSVMAAFELGRRFLEERAGADRKLICTARGVYELMIPTMKGLGREELYALFLNKSGRFIRKELLTTGSLDHTVIDNKLVIEAAIRCGASSLILVHNHPGGDPHPSKSDIACTSSLRHACSAFDITMLDHVVVCDNCFWSFADDRLYGA